MSLDLLDIQEYRLGLVPLDTDVLSLEMPEIFKSCYVEGDNSSLQIVANAVYNLQTTYGLIPNIKVLIIF